MQLMVTSKAKYHKKWVWLHLEVDAQVLLAAHRVGLDEVADEGHAIVDEDLDDWHQQRDGVDDVDGHLLLATLCHDTNVGPKDGD